MQTDTKMQNWLIAGASSGIGMELMNAAYARGYNVCGLARKFNEKPFEDSTRERVLKLHCDVRDQSEVNDCISAAKERFGSIDVVFCNAGILQSALFEATTDEMLHNILETNFYGTIHVLRAVIQILKAQGYGKIIINTSKSGLSPRNLGTGYCASKHALEAVAGVLRLECSSFCQVMALEMGWFSGTDIVKSQTYISPGPNNYLKAEYFSEVYKFYKNDLSIAIKLIIEEIEKPQLPAHFILGADALSMIKATSRTLIQDIHMCSASGYSCSLPIDGKLRDTIIPLLKMRFTPGKVKYYFWRIPFISLRPDNYIKLKKFVKKHFRYMRNLYSKILH